MKINFFNETNDNIREYQRVIRDVFKTINSKKEFNVIFVDENEIKRINNEFRHIDKVTDVISFALIDDNEIVQTNELGDVFICVNKAKSQALEYGHSEKRELSFLTVHGLLHLLGYDHMTKDEEKVMFSMQEEILEDADIKK